jgi:hypothetical protein
VLERAAIAAVVRQDRLGDGRARNTVKKAAGRLNLDINLLKILIGAIDARGNLKAYLPCVNCRLIGDFRQVKVGSPKNTGRPGSLPDQKSLRLVTD